LINLPTKPTSTAKVNAGVAPMDLAFLLKEWKAMFSPATIGPDFFAGLTVAMVALPLNLALAVASGVDPSLGIVSGIVAGIIAALFGGQRYAITGPAAAMAVVLIEVAHNFGMGGIWFVALVGGLLQIAAGFLRLGRIISFIPMPVIVGFANAIGLLIIFNTIDDFFGLASRPLGRVAQDSVVGAAFVPEFVKDITDLVQRIFIHQEGNYQAVAIGVLVIVLAVIMPRITKAVPGTLVAIVVASIAAHYMHFNIPRIIDLAPLSSINLMPHWPTLPQGITTFQQYQALTLYAITVFMLGSIESLLSATVADGMSMRSKHRPDQELIGQGLANFFMPFFGGIPVTGVIARTAVNITAGARTRLAAIVHSLVLLVLAYSLSNLAEQIPLAALAGVLVLTGYRLIEWDEVREIWKGSRTEGWVVIATTFASVFIDLTAGVLTGLLLTCVLFVHKMSSLSLVSEVAEDDDRIDASQAIPSCKYSRTYLVDGPLFFGAAERFTENILLTQDLRALILNVRSLNMMDITGVETLLAIQSQMRRKNVRLVIAELPGQPLELMKKTGAYEKIGADNIFSDYKEALLDVNEKLLMNECQGCSAGLNPELKGKVSGPKDCKLRSALLMDNSKITKTLKARMDRTQAIRTGTFQALSPDIARLVRVAKPEEIPQFLLGTPIETLLKAQNMGQIDANQSEDPDLVIGMCIDYRKSLALPQNCSYVIRRTGANMAGSEFSVALALSGGIEYMALIAHNHCVMSNPHVKRGAFVGSLTDKHGWSEDQAMAFFDQHASSREINDAIDFSVKEARRLSSLFRGLKVVPMLFMLEDNLIYLVKDWIRDQEGGEAVVDDPYFDD
jgi:SulP family sulfate permease